MSGRASWLAVAALLALPASADIAPPNASQCRELQAGAACTLDDGGAGVCTESWVTRPDYSAGPPPSYRRVKVLLCVAAGATRARAAPWGLALAIAALGLGSLALRRRRRPAGLSPARG